ncbi:MAG: cytochrome c biogenesis protein ResB, partial [Deferribacterales bacterium]|nr:cytochrome c biogenesis protein ResB [Deferribacterales bacterium]
MKKFISFLSSAKFSVIIILLILILSVIGSFIPQGDGSAVIERLSSFFGSDAAAIHSFLISSGLIDIYSSYPFLILIVLFAVNIILCTLKLIPFARTGFTGYSGNLNESGVTDLTEAELVQKLGKSGWKGSKEGDIYRAVKHEGGKYGVIILHAGVIIVLFGALVGHIAGFNGFINILEGTSDDVAVLPSGELVPLGFEVRCNEFAVEYYPNSDRPKSYTSFVTILEQGKEVKTAEIDVNNPLKYNDIVFYQTNFGIYPNKSAKVRFRISINDKDEKSIEASFDELFIIDGNYVGKITDFAPTLARDGEGNIFSSSDEMKNPAILIEIYNIDEPVLRGWVLKNYPESGIIDELGLKIHFDELWGVEYTGLSVKKDPGTPIVYIGFIFMIFGLIFIYLLNYTVILFTVEDR